MRLPVVVALLAGVSAFAAPNATDPERPKVGVLRFTEVGVTQEFTASVSGVVANELDRSGVFRVFTAQAIAEMLALERQQQLMGCAEDNQTCMAEIVDALGLDYMVSGKVAKTGAGAKARWTLDLTLTNVRSSRREGSQVVDALSESETLDLARQATRKLVGAILEKYSGRLAIQATEPGATVKVDDVAVGVTPLAPLTLAGGAHRVTVEKKGFLAATAEAKVSPKAVAEVSLKLVPSPDYLREYETSAKRMRLGAWIATGLGVVGLATGGAMQLRANALYGSDQAPGTFSFYRAQLASGVESDGSTNFRTAATALGAEIKSSELISQIGFAAGGVGAAAAAFFWIAGEDPDRYAKKPGVQLSFVPAPGAPSASVLVRF